MGGEYARHDPQQEDPERQSAQKEPAEKAHIQTKELCLVAFHQLHGFFPRFIDGHAGVFG